MTSWIPKTSHFSLSTLHFFWKGGRPLIAFRVSGSAQPALSAEAEMSRDERKWRQNPMFYTYILQSKIHKRLYVGSTSDLLKRIAEHNRGGVDSTKPYKPWQLIYYEAHLTKTLARKAELFYKTGQGRRQIKKKLGIDEEGDE